VTALALANRPDTVPAGTAAADLLATDLVMLRGLAATATAAQVRQALARPRRTLEDFAALVSPSGADRLEEMAGLAHETTVRRFGRTMRLFAPLYLSNECLSVCTYCGFSAGNDITRRTLSVEEVVAEGRALAAAGFRHLLLVSGEHARVVSREYLTDCVAALAPFVPSVSIEVQVWDTDTYRSIVEAGGDGLVVYQESYDRKTYGAVHVKGKKRNYDWRLSAPDRGAEAGMRRVGIGALFGLHPDWQTEALALATHARALVRRWWRTEVTVSLPRLQPCAGSPEPNVVLDDPAFVQLLCALRLLLPDVGIVLSTRERPALRDVVLPLGVTHLSAGSHTEPGGYAGPSEAEPQFAVADTRSPAEVAILLQRAGYDPVWKDWQRV
jgi:2-iminoacetate synthase